jgi:hypothetical protein
VGGDYIPWVAGFLPALVDIDPAKGICSWVASAKALRQIGLKAYGRIFIIVDDLAATSNVHISLICLIFLIDQPLEICRMW